MKTDVQLQKIKPLLRNYVLQSTKSVDIHWDPNLEELPLNFNPYLPSEREHCAQYFLMVAAIDRPEYVGRSETARALMIEIEKILGAECFKQGQTKNFEMIIQKIDHLRLGPFSYRIPTVLDTVNLFVEQNAKEGLIGYALKFSNPGQMIVDLASKIPYLSGVYFEHCWMYLRWMTRPFPDFNVFKNFSLKDLKLPLTATMQKKTGLLKKQLKKTESTLQSLLLLAICFQKILWLLTTLFMS